MFFFYQHTTLLQRLYCNFFFKKSMATSCSPIWAYSACISWSFSFVLLPASFSKTAAELLKNSFFQVLICVGCSSYFFAKASIVCCSLMASIQTLLLNSAVNLRRLVLLILTGLIMTNFYLNHLSEKRGVLYSAVLIFHDSSARYKSSFEKLMLKLITKTEYL